MVAQNHVLCQSRMLSELEDNDKQEPMSTRSTSDDEEYVLVNLKQMENLFNNVQLNHDCTAKGSTLSLIVDEKRIISISLIAKCKNCNYVSSPFKMYREVSSIQRGPKQSSLNLALGTCLQTLPINSLNFIHLSTGIGMDPPSHSGMQKLMNTCNSINFSLGQKSIAREVKRAQKRKQITSELHASTDAMYNNNIFASTTPTHAATQAYMTVINQENNKVLHVGIFNKQCHKGKYLEKKGITVKCGTGIDHEGGCSANLPPDAPIGQEAEYTIGAAKCLKEKDASPTSFTKDGDASVRKALIEFYGADNIEILSDEHHLNSSFKKQARKQQFSDNMFKVRTKRIKQVEINNFTEDLASRCHNEIEQARKAHKMFPINIRKNKILESLKDTPSAIISCLKGQHSLCTTSSFMCNPQDGKEWNFRFLNKRNRELELDSNDHTILKKLLAMRIGSQALEVLWRGTSTQMNEAFNRKIRKHLPKSTNFTRNCSGRVLSAAQCQNEGYRKATQILNQKIQFQTCRKNQNKLEQEEHRQKYHKMYQKKQSSKSQRFMRKFNKYRNHRSKFIKVDSESDDDSKSQIEVVGYSKHSDIYPTA